MADYDYQGKREPNASEGEVWLDSEKGLRKISRGWEGPVGSGGFKGWRVLDNQIKRDVDGSVKWHSVASGLTTTESGTITTTPMDKDALFVRAKGTLGTSVGSPSVVLSIANTNTKTLSETGGSTTLTFDTSWDPDTLTFGMNTSVHIKANAAVTSGSGTLTLTVYRQDQHGTVFTGAIAPIPT